ncbi:MAG: hypothetical protein CMIDDMOC_00114 [Sodalis sp. Fle]|nr:MAG: hypothetical protein CMIDDMOC_00114 [Sodalis sp. Fle]
MIIYALPIDIFYTVIGPFLLKINFDVRKVLINMRK